MKTVLLLIVLISVAFGCSPPPKAPAMKRVPNYEQIDENYLTNVFLASYTGPSSKSDLSNSVSQFEEHLAEFRTFMHDVEAGKIPVTQGFKGDWQSLVKQKDAWTFVGYWNSSGMVADFQKHKSYNPYPLVYGFQFSTNGYLTWATTIEDDFKFDERGKVEEYWHK